MKLLRRNPVDIREIQSKLGEKLTVAVAEAAADEPDPEAPLAAQYWTPKATTWLETSAPQASAEQSRRAFPKLASLHKQETSFWAQPKDWYKPRTLLTHIC